MPLSPVPACHPPISGAIGHVCLDAGNFHPVTSDGWDVVLLCRKGPRLPVTLGEIEIPALAQQRMKGGTMSTTLPLGAV